MSNAGNDTPQPSRSTGRRGLLRAAAGGALAAATATAVVPRRKALAQSPLPARALQIMNGPKYRISRWFLYFADRTTGETLYALNDDDLVLPASVTKLWATATALDAYGPDFRFETPIYKRGTADSAGTLDGDLILVASGDLTMGGRNTPQGTINFTSFDHIYANTVPGATLTPENPLAGLDELAQQVAAAGIRRVRDVLIDARLFEQYPKDDYILSPIMINDNLIDLTVVPGAAGQTATVEWRPQTAAYTVQSQVRTMAAGGTAAVTATLPRPGVIVVEGTIPAGGGTVLRTAQVADPPAFARTLLIEALGRAGVTTDAAPLGPNPAAQLPPSGSYVAADRVALLTSLPFSQNIRLINKVSLNQGADTLIMLLAVKNGQRTFDAGMTRILPFIQTTGIDPDLISLSDGRGGPGEADLFSMRTVTRLLRYMTTRPDFPAYYDSLPVFGEVGSEVDTVPPTSPLKGKAHAKSGTLVSADLMHQSLMVTSRGNAGYMTSKSGREIAFGLYVMYAPIKTIEDIFATLADVGDAVEAFYEVT